MVGSNLAVFAAASVGQDSILLADFQSACLCWSAISAKADSEIGQQDGILPHPCGSLGTVWIVCAISGRRNFALTAIAGRPMILMRVELLHVFQRGLFQLRDLFVDRAHVAGIAVGVRLRWYHRGQIVMLAKHFQSGQWKSLSVPRGKYRQEQHIRALAFSECRGRQGAARQFSSGEQLRFYPHHCSPAAR